MALTTPGEKSACVHEMRAGREVAVWGRLDVSTVADVRLALHEVLARGSGDLLIHLAQAEVHDATGLGVIVGVHHRARRLGRRLILVDVSPRLDRLLRASRLHRVLARGPVEHVVAVLPATEVTPPSTETTEVMPPPTETVASFTD